MVMQQQHHDKVRLTVECTFDERMFIKMLAAKRHVTISELLLDSVRKVIPAKKNKTPNKETIHALKQSRKSKLKSYDNLENFWEAMGIDPDA